MFVRLFVSLQLLAGGWRCVLERVRLSLRAQIRVARSLSQRNLRKSKPVERAHCHLLEAQVRSRQGEPFEFAKCDLCCESAADRARELRLFSWQFGVGSLNQGNHHSKQSHEAQLTQNTHTNSNQTKNLHAENAKNAHARPPARTNQSIDQNYRSRRHAGNRSIANL